MKKLFYYNWQKREEWFDWCDYLSEDEFHKKRTGGVQSFSLTLFHIIDVEQRWLARVTNQQIIRYNPQDFRTVSDLRRLSSDHCATIDGIISNLTDVHLKKQIPFQFPKTGEETFCTGEEVLFHVIAHEIHHTGQLSVWARDLHREPVSANLIGRELY